MSEVKAVRKVNHLISVDLSEEEMFDSTEWNWNHTKENPFQVQRIYWPPTWSREEVFDLDSNVRVSGKRRRRSDGQVGQMNAKALMTARDLPHNLGQRMLDEFSRVYAP